MWNLSYTMAWRLVASTVSPCSVGTGMVYMFSEPLDVVVLLTVWVGVIGMLNPFSGLICCMASWRLLDAAKW